MLNSAERERLESLTDIELVEDLIRRQSEVLDLYAKREASKNNMEQWEYYHELYYSKTSDLIDVKYMVIGRMHK